ncbi:MAG: DNA gyrase subunit A [Bryobacteraceae bacterium]|nr:DNA gyrase subunit A [Bryobacteraceae bacterium]
MPEAEHPETDGPRPSQLPLSPPPGGQSVPVNIEDEMRRSYLDYAMSVIIGRALPDVRDGLKPVHRRILYGMHEMGLTYNRPTRKCAKIVGEVMGKYHPHGDVPVYDALVRMAQPFSMRYPLVEGQGNFGSVDGDPPAAMRYTEARLARIASAMLADIDKETVDFRPNYDDSEREPEVLPARIPNLLINGSSGIAVGMATNIPPHNLREIVQAAIALLQNPNLPEEKLLELVPGPDFPTGGFICGRQGIRDAYLTGRGQLKLRARAAIERIGKDREAIVVTEIPYQVQKSRLVEQVAALLNEKKIEGIADIRDESDREGMRIVFELKKGEQAQVVLNNLYKHTQMQVNYGVIMLAIVNGQPRELSLGEMLRRFLDHRIEVVRRRTEFELRKAREREHILLGFQKALDQLDLVIETIRASSTPKEAREILMGLAPLPARVIEEVVVAGDFRFDFSDRQAQAIMELQLQRLTGMERQKILEELAETQRRIAEYLEILGSEKALHNVIVRELRELEREYGDERRTEIVDDVADITLEDLIADEDMVVTVTRQGYLKRTSVASYRRQGRGGRGRRGMEVREEDFIEHLIVASTHAYLLVFTDKGRVYWLKVYEIPEAASSARGKHISHLVALQPDDSVKAILPVREFVHDRFVVMATRRGVVKKCELSEFDNPIARGIIAITLDEGDELIAARLSSGNDEIFLGSYRGKAVRFAEEEVRPMGRQARGVTGMDLADDDHVVGMEVVTEDALILSISELGYGKRTPLSAYRKTRRGAQGVINMKTTERNGPVAAVLAVRENSEVMVVTKEGQIIRLEAAQIREAGRSTQGVKIVRLEPGDRIAAASVIPDEEFDNGGTAPAGDNGAQPELPLGDAETPL